MNSLNILSARVSPPATPTPSRSNSYGNILTSAALGGSRRNSRGDINEKREGTEETQDADNEEPSFDEKTPLLQDDSPYSSSNSRSWHSIPKSIAIVLMDSVRWVLSTLAAPGVYLIACLYDEQGIFAPFTQIRKLGGGRSYTAQALGMSSADEGKYGHSNGRSTAGRRGGSKSQRSIGSNSSSSGLSSESESDREHPSSEGKQSSSRPRTRSQSLQKGDEIAPANKTIRIKLHNEDNLRQRRHRKTQSTSSQSNGSGAISASDPATLKSPTSPAASASLSMTKYPRAPAPPRPLIPRRQPSFTLSDMPTSKLGQKTLILDLDETLIHSMAKGGRMGTGHMIEVRLNSYGPGGNGSSHPILYWVNKRPHCDEFLRRVSCLSDSRILVLMDTDLQMV
jgi:CTD nuclear envelope phosphatase 1